LLDVGHCLITREDPAAVIARAGRRLCYVHFDDNDGVSDLHLPLLARRWTEARLAAVADALRASGYRGPLALELSPENPGRAEAFDEGKALLAQLLRGAVSQGPLPGPGN